MIGRTTCVVWVRNLALRTSPSLPFTTSTTLPSGHIPRGEFSSIINTRSWSLTFGQSFCHFRCLCSKGKYSLTHRFQNNVVRYRTWRHRRLYISVSWNTPSGTEASLRKSSKWFGVSGASSWISSVHLVRGRLLIKFSISQNTVNRISSVRRGLNPRTDRMTRRIDLIKRSQTPPWCEPCGGLKCHSTFLRLAARTILSRSNDFILLTISVRAPTILVPLSDQISHGQPHLAMNLRNALIKESVSRLCTTSKCTALVLKHVKITPYRFTSERPERTRNGPKRSRPVYVNGG